MDNKFIMDIIYNTNITVEYIKDENDDLYRRQLLNAFNIKGGGVDSITSEATVVYNQVKDNVDIKHYIDLINQKVNTYAIFGMIGSSDDDECPIGFIMFLSYNLFESAHRCLCDIYTNNDRCISPNNNSQMLADINKLFV